MTSNKGYTQILKATSVLGSIQVVGILVSIVRSKLVSVWIGASGYGIFGILSTLIDVFKTFTGLGLETTGITPISQVANQPNTSELQKQAGILLRLTLTVGVLGAVLMVLLAYWISWFTFSTTTYTLGIALLGLVILLKHLTTGKAVIMQGMQRYKLLALAGLYGNIIGLLVALPLFYYFRVKAIVPVLLLTALVSYGATYYFYKKLGLHPQRISTKAALQEARPMLLFGGLLTLTGVLPSLSNYFIQWFIHSKGSLEQVGFFTVALTLTHSYVGIIFTALSSDYYPRLSAVINVCEQVNTTVNQQTVITLLLITPVVIGAVGFAPWLIQLLFSDKFLPATPLLQWALISMFFKALSFALGYIIIARSDSKIILKTSFGYAIMYVVLSFLGYYYMGLKGLGIAFAVYYALHALSNYLLTYNRYQFRYHLHTLKIIVIELGLVLCSILLLLFWNTLGIYIYLWEAVLLLVSLYFSFTKLKGNMRSVFKKAKEK